MNAGDDESRAEEVPQSLERTHELAKGWKIWRRRRSEPWAAGRDGRMHCIGTNGRRSRALGLVGKDAHAHMCIVASTYGSLVWLWILAHLIKSGERHAEASRSQTCRDMQRHVYVNFCPAGSIQHSIDAVASKGERKRDSASRGARDQNNKST